MKLDRNTLTLIKKACKGKRHIKLTVGYVLNDKITVKVFNENGRIQNKNYIYEIASITKTFTASLMAKYIHENKMSLDDSIQKYFDGLNDGRYYPTLKRLATHTAGYSMALPYAWPEFLMMHRTGFPAMPNADKVKAVLKKKLRQDKDYPWMYSNYGFTLIGHALGVTFGKGYWVAMDDFLSNELGLQNTYTGTRPKKNLHGFNKRNKDCGNFNYEKCPDVPGGDGDISATAYDLLRYAQINMNDEKPYLALCHKKQASVSSVFAKVYRSVAGIREFDMGLGWWIDKDDHDILSHGGDLDSFCSYMTIDKDKKLASVVLSNYQIDTVKIGLSLLEFLQKR